MHSSTPTLLAPTPLVDDTEGKNQPIGLAALDGYSNNLTAAATNEKAVMEQLVTNLITLTTSNTDMEATINKVRQANWLIVSLGVISQGCW